MGDEKWNVEMELAGVVQDVRVYCNVFTWEAGAPIWYALCATLGLSAIERPLVLQRDTQD